MDKVKVSREVAEVINALEKSRLSRDTVLRNYATYLDAAVERKTNLYQTFVNKGIDLLRLAEILVKGYEVEQTPQEQLKEAYLDHRNLSNANFKYSEGFCEGIEFTLETLNIKVSGVNT